MQPDACISTERKENIYQSNLKMKAMISTRIALQHFAFVHSWDKAPVEHTLGPGAEGYL